MMRNLLAAIILAAGFPLAATAVEAHHQPATAAASDAAQLLADGEVRKVDKDASKITIRHGPIPSLDMPAMSMVFQVKNPALLDQVKAGDKIRFSAEKVGGAYVVTHLEPAR